MVVCPCWTTAGSVEMEFYRCERFGRIRHKRPKSDKWLGSFGVEILFCGVLELFEDEKGGGGVVREQCAKISIRFLLLHSAHFEVGTIKLTMLPHHKSPFSVFTVFLFIV